VVLWWPSPSRKSPSYLSISSPVLASPPLLAFCPHWYLGVPPPPFLFTHPFFGLCLPVFFHPLLHISLLLSSFLNYLLFCLLLLYKWPVCSGPFPIAFSLTSLFWSCSPIISKPFLLQSLTAKLFYTPTY